MILWLKCLTNFRAAAKSLLITGISNSNWPNINQVQNAVGNSFALFSEQTRALMTVKITLFLS